MRILIDLQACQSTGSRHRGIGRYSLSLAQAMARNAGSHEMHLLLNSLFADSLSPVQQAFDGLIAHRHFHYWKSPAPVNEFDPGNAWRVRAGEMLREQAIAEWQPDMVHVSSLFEGLTDNALTSIGQNGDYQPTAVTLYDLIPLINSAHYLENDTVRAWYFRKVHALKRADLLLAISGSSRQEGLDWLNLPPERIVNISSAVDERFGLHDYAPDSLTEIKTRYGLTRPYLMYTGGIDLRKNVEALIRAFAALPPTFRQQYQLAIVCSVQPADRERLQSLMKQAGLQDDEVVLTGFVPDEVLPPLYHACALFVFPSWHEGFGLPALEAMSCGAPVIASNTSSLPEVVGRADALFNPHDERAITEKLFHTLSDKNYLQSLREHGMQQAKKFSWDASAKTALAAFEQQHDLQVQKKKVSVGVTSDQPKPRLAYFSPLPPERSGIADYSAELLPELSAYYEIDLIIDQAQVSDDWLSANFPLRSLAWFAQHAHRYDRIVYNFGNSTYHTYMLDVLDRYPGIVVLHDFFLSGLMAHLELTGSHPQIWSQALYRSHGFQALLAKQNTDDLNQIIWAYPCNHLVMEMAAGMIVHSEFSMKLARQWYGEQATDNWQRIPHMRNIPQRTDRQKARQELGMQAEDFLVCSFGLMGPTKLNHMLLDAWLQSPLAADPHCHLVFVGKNDAGEYGSNLLKKIKQAGLSERITITGFADAKLFQTYLQAADAGVQLRGLSRGESSYTVLDCMAYGLPTIVNSNGAMAELPEHALIKLEEDFELQVLAEKLLTLRESVEFRQQLGAKALEHMKLHHMPHKVARQYFDFIEHVYQHEAVSQLGRTLSGIARLDGQPAESDLLSLAQCLASNQSMAAAPRVLLDLSEVKTVLPAQTMKLILTKLLVQSPAPWRLEPVLFDKASWRYAHGFACRTLGLSPVLDEDEVIELRPEDVLVRMLDANQAQEVAPTWQGAQLAQEAGIRALTLFIDVANLEKTGGAEKNVEMSASVWWQQIQ